ncbi:hypothetical protein ABG067_004379 [Albugo candida]|uniref:Uncharacterized protein n=1 Tax=Albugo candida TaxID=65357 RepID=A0A024GLE4_9STRA|nr:unnamed protein product [Albugo candida]|eukprot:CCI47584.1 unnamed protein product [Albugo candida]
MGVSSITILNRKTRLLWPVRSTVYHRILAIKCAHYGCFQKCYLRIDCLQYSHGCNCANNDESLLRTVRLSDILGVPHFALLQLGVSLNRMQHAEFVIAISATLCFGRTKQHNIRPNRQSS